MNASTISVCRTNGFLRRHPFCPHHLFTGHGAGWIIPLIWPVLRDGYHRARQYHHSAGEFGPMLFGTGERLLLPFGLHHILVALIRFTEAGGTQEVCGHSVSGALTIFQAR